MHSHLVRPFAALRPTASSAAEVVAPPYDVVNTDEARTLTAGRPRSFLHISRPEIDLPAGSSPHADEAYTQGAKNLAQLVADGTLIREQGPSFYVYRMRMGAHVQTGVAFAASVDAYEQHRIRRHELTRPDKENDRVRNIDALNAQTGPVLLAYRADGELDSLITTAARDVPLFEVPGPNGVQHAIWRVSSDALEPFWRALDALPALYIADGHHRSAAAARVAATRGGAATASHRFFLAVAFAHDAMRILDYNRVVRDLNGLSIEAFLARIHESCSVTECAGRCAPSHTETFGLFVGNRWYSLQINPALVPRHDPVASLDVSLLQDRLLTPVLGIGDPRTDPRIDFVGGIRGLEELERRVHSGEAAAAFALYPTRMEQLMSVADAGALMPPKSTWFEPKLADGLLSHVLD